MSGITALTEASPAITLQNRTKEARDRLIAGLFLFNDGINDLAQQIAI